MQTTTRSVFSAGVRFAALTLFLIAAMMSAGCGGIGAVQDDPPAAANAASTDAPKTIPTIKTMPCQAVFIGALDDQSASMDGAITRMKAHDLEPLIEVVQRRCGVLAVGAIRSQSYRSLVRMTVPPAFKPPTEPQTNGSVWDPKTQEAWGDYEAATKEYKRRAAARAEQIERDIKQFREQTVQLLDNATTSEATDIFGGLKRLDLLLGEPDAAFGGNAQRVGLLVTDGQSTVLRPMEPFRSSAKFYVVNGTRSLADLVILRKIAQNLILLESPGAAIRAIVTDVEAH